MKDWFDNLKNTHKLFLIVALYVATVVFAEISPYNELFSLLCVGCLIFAIIFTVFYVKHKKRTKNQAFLNQTVSISENVASDTPTQTKQPEKTPEIDISPAFPKIYDDCFLRWEYKENIALCQNLDKVELKDRYIEHLSGIRLVPEPDNQYDPNAVALYKGEYKLGYFYKGQTQEMILSYLNRKDYLIKTVVCLLDRENNKLAVGIAFYRKLSSVQLDSLTVPLTRITKKTEDFATSRYENVANMDVGDYVEISENFDDRYTVCDEYCNELGELSATEKMVEIFEDIKYAKIADIQLTDNDTYKVKISIFY